MTHQQIYNAYLKLQLRKQQSAMCSHERKFYSKALYDLLDELNISHSPKRCEKARLYLNELNEKN